MILSLKNFSGMRPRYTRFGVPANGATYCKNIAFEANCIAPAWGRLFEDVEGESSFPAIPADNVSDVDGISQLVFDNPVLPSVDIIKPVYVFTAGGTQTVFIYYTTTGSGYSAEGTTTFAEGTEVISRERDGYKISLFPTPRVLNAGRWWSFQSSNILNIVNKIDINGLPMYAQATPYYTDSNVSNNTVSVISTTNKKPVTLSISGAVSASETPNWYGNGVWPNASPHISIVIFVTAEETYRYSANVQYKFSLLDTEGNIIFSSAASEQSFMDVGDGVRVNLPSITEDGVPIPLSRFKVYRSTNFAPYEEISITTGDLIDE